MESREAALEVQVRVLAERLALSLMSNTVLMQAIVLLDGRQNDRDMLMEEYDYLEQHRAIRRLLTDELRKARLER